MTGLTDAEWKHLTETFPRVLKGAKVANELRAVRADEGQPPFICGAFSPDGTMIALSGGGRIPSKPAIWVARVPTFETVAALHGHQGIHDLAWDPKTGLLASASNDYCAVLWSIERKDHLFVYGGNDEPIVKGAVAFGDGVLYIGESEPFVELSSRLLRVDLASGKITTVHDLGRPKKKRLGIGRLVVDPATDAWAFTADDFDYFDHPSLVRGRGKEAGASLSQHVAALAFVDGELVVELAPEEDEDEDDEKDPEDTRIAFAPDGTKMIGRGAEISTDAWTTKVDPSDKPRGHSLMRCSPDGKHILVAGFQYVALLDAKTGKVLATPTPPAWFKP